MSARKRVLITVSVIFTVAIVYTWGHLDGRTGRTIGFTDVAFAAEKYAR